MIGPAELQAIGRLLQRRSGNFLPAVYDSRIDAAALAESDDPTLLLHVRQQLLFRAYQARYILLPSQPSADPQLECFQRHYDPHELAVLEECRRPLERALLEPLLIQARARVVGVDISRYVEQLLPALRTAPESPLLVWLRGSPERNAYYRNFLIQSSIDLLAEASASALGVIGEFGTVQSALFRILIDEFGCGVHRHKHSELYRSTLRDFAVADEYNACWPWFDSSTLQLHNAIHYLFQSPGHLFLQIGFLLYAETAYQRTTQDHFRYLQQFHPQIDARYFGEHAHIDRHHTAMMVDEVIVPLVAGYGEAAGREIVAGAELTAQLFAVAGAHTLAVSQAFAHCAAAGRAVYGMPQMHDAGECLTPSMAGSTAEGPAVQVGGIGQLIHASDFASFPAGTIGRQAARVAQ